ncbi:Hypothetical Protein SLY_0753 [Strawberry lethal yellows phytoplasma (CPA) str. NZSb11]|uniref:Uncharacterized protein n=1 Tax=Strawberry lethal yellows phytoplasma (CPA) str. NZSb11 TaxID=980422 RepID=R4RXN5_PHYAS|nr:Hypothetical Protein SLY_0753 [Strawberry lethal yellows phytoplasma (CPA) str. NZSb11]
MHPTKKASKEMIFLPNGKQTHLDMVLKNGVVK